MTTDTLFTGTTPTQTTPPTTEGEGQVLLTALVGEKQKYKSVEELAKAYVNADNFLNTLKAENAKLREENSKAKALDEVLDQLKQQTHAKDDTPAASITQEQVATIVSQQLTKEKTEEARKANLLKADKAMKEKFGDKAGEVFGKAATTEAQKNVLTELAAVDPDKFVALFVGNGGVTTSIDAGTVNTAALDTNVTSTKEWSREWVNEVRKKDPNKYWSSEFQYELQQKVTRQPTLFFG